VSEIVPGPYLAKVPKEGWSPKGELESRSDRRQPHFYAPASHPRIFKYIGEKTEFLYSQEEGTSN
jgi:hypothetical protein